MLRLRCFDGDDGYAGVEVAPPFEDIAQYLTGDVQTVEGADAELESLRAVMEGGAPDASGYGNMWHLETENRSTVRLRHGYEPNYVPMEMPLPWLIAALEQFRDFLLDRRARRMAGKLLPR